MKCRKCQFNDPEGRICCRHCDTSLNANGPNLEAQPEPGKARRIPERERKRLTAVFSDLVGFISWADKLDPEQVKKISGRIFTIEISLGKSRIPVSTRDRSGESINKKSAATKGTRQHENNQRVSRHIPG
jgi:hypothetical protein